MVVAYSVIGFLVIAFVAVSLLNMDLTYKNSLLKHTIQEMKDMEQLLLEENNRIINELTETRYAVQDAKKHKDQLPAWDEVGEIDDIAEEFLDFLISLDGDNSDSDILKRLKEGESITDSITKRFARCDEISSEQQAITGSLEGPSKGAAFSRHRNGVSAYLKELERERIEIMQSIVDDGYDPNINMVDEDGKQQIRLSELIVKLKENIGDNEADLPPIKEKPKRHLSLVPSEE